jgi:hypothetical protein
VLEFGILGSYIDLIVIIIVPGHALKLTKNGTTSNSRENLFSVAVADELDYTPFI